MSFLVSRCVGMVTPDPGVAADYYRSTFGMVDGPTEAIVELLAGPIKLYIDPGKSRPVVFELVTEDATEARADLKRFGFEELVWRGKGQSCLVRDPFGIVFNIYEDHTAFFPIGLESPAPGFVKPCVGAILPTPADAALFYADVLDSSADRLPDGSYIVDSGAMRMRFKFGQDAAPVVWLKADAPVPHLVAANCEITDNGVVTDPFGVQWCTEPINVAPRAVCCPL